MHVFPLQQPVGHDVALQTHLPAEHAWPLAQAEHAAPAAPQLAADGVWHLPSASQQPLGHEVASQTHLPCVEHSCQAGHALQDSAARAAKPSSKAWCKRRSRSSRRSSSRQLQAPALQAWPLAHGPHLLPPSPQPAVDCALTRMQVSF